MYLSDRNLAYDEENTAEPKRKRKQKITVKASKATAPLITKMNQINTFGKKYLSISFMKVTMKRKMFKDQKTIIQAIMKVTAKFLTFFLVKILVMNGYLKHYEIECFI